MTEFYASWGLEDVGLLKDALEALLTSLRIERALSGPGERAEIDRYGRRIRNLQDQLATVVAAQEERCPVCHGFRWVGTSEPGKPFSSWRKLPCSACAT